MSSLVDYSPGRPYAQIDKDGEKWTLVLEREMRHSPEKVWEALTDPEHLRQWAPFDADGNLGAAGNKVKLTTVGAPKMPATETTVARAEPPHLLEYKWGEFNVRWELERVTGGTRLKLRTNIARPYIAMGAAGWHICLDVMDRLIAGTPIQRIVGPDAMKIEVWQRLHKEYAKKFGNKSE